MNRKIWTHGFYTNSFDPEINQWKLCKTGTDEVVAQGPKAEPLGVLGSALTRVEKAQAKYTKLKEQLEEAQMKVQEADQKLIEAQSNLHQDDPEA